tara:strand:+ start:230 stop:1792 length:1563 start_codon:yes stop_codon:yes gene_type:complete
MVQIPDALATKFGRAQGRPVNGACNTPRADNVKSMIAGDDGSKMAKIAKGIGMDEKCQRESKTYSDQGMIDSDTLAAAGGLWGAAVATNATTVTNNINEDSMIESGCGSFASVASTILNETANISCTLNSSLSGTTTEVKSGAKITVRTIRPGDEALAVIKANTTTLSDNMTKASMAVPIIPPGTSPELARMYFERSEKVTASHASVLNKYIEEQPISAGLFNSNLNLRIQNKVKMKSSQTFDSNHKAKLETSIKSIAAAAAEQKLSQDLGFRAGTPNTKQVIDAKVDNLFKNQQKSIEDKITNSFTRAVSENEILIEIQGPIVGSDIIADMMIQTNVQTSQAVKSGISIGQRVAAELAGDVLSGTDTTTNADGFNDLVAAANAGLAEQQRAKGDSDAATFGGMGDAAGSIFSGMAMMMIIPLIIIGGLLMFAPKLTKFIPPQIKIPLMIGIVVLILLVIFGGIFSASSRRRFPTSTEFMSVSGNRADTLGYMITNTKGKINKKPYQDFNFTAGGTWDLN